MSYVSSLSHNLCWGFSGAFPPHAEIFDVIKLKRNSRMQTLIVVFVALLAVAMAFTAGK